MSWSALNESQLRLLDNYLVEYVQAEEHRIAALKLKRHLSAKLDLYDPKNVHTWAMERAKYLAHNPYSRAVADKNQDEAKWLEARRTGVTATEVAKLAQNRESDRNQIMLEKLTGERSFFGNKYTAWGLEREPFIGAELFREKGFLASDVLFHAPGEIRHLATPDGVKQLEDGTVLISEIKTGKNDLNPAGDHFKKTSYFDQMQWQMYVMGETCKKCFFAWEQHDDNWQVGEDGIERPAPLPLQSAWIERDKERINHLIGIANAFLDEIEWQAA